MISLCGRFLFLYLQQTPLLPSHKGLEEFFDLHIISNTCLKILACCIKGRRKAKKQKKTKKRRKIVNTKNKKNV